MLLRFLLYLFAFIGALAATGALVVSAVLMLRFPPLLIAVILACWILCKLLKMFRKPGQNKTQNAPTSVQ